MEIVLWGGPADGHEMVVVGKIEIVRVPAYDVDHTGRKVMAAVYVYKLDRSDRRWKHLRTEPPSSGE